MRRMMLAGTTLALSLVAGVAVAQDDAPARRERWQAIARMVFGTRPVIDGALIAIDAPSRAADAALVPVTLTMAEPDRIAGIRLIIDDNPSPEAAHVVFGPAADRSALSLRVRVDSYTNMHAVAETTDGALVAATRFIKASGGCSAPMGATDEEAMAGMGDIRMKFGKPATSGGPVPATLMIRHPNFNGMQMNQLTRFYTPARYVNAITIRQGDADVLRITSDISLAANPVIGFAFTPRGDAPVTVVATDTTGGRWERSFAPGPAA